MPAFSVSTIVWVTRLWVLFSKPHNTAAYLLIPPQNRIPSTFLIAMNYYASTKTNGGANKGIRCFTLIKIKTNGAAITRLNGGLLYFPSTVLNKSPLPFLYSPSPSWADRTPLQYIASRQQGNSLYFVLCLNEGKVFFCWSPDYYIIPFYIIVSNSLKTQTQEHRSRLLNLSSSGSENEAYIYHSKKGELWTVAYTKVLASQANVTQWAKFGVKNNHFRV